MTGKRVSGRVEGAGGVSEATNVIVIGGGASGMAAAIAAARKGERVLLLEKLDQTGKKLLATGNGRCNLMNRNPLRYYGDSEFALAVMGRDAVGELTAFWESLGLRLRYDEEGRGYPCTFQAATVRDALMAELRRLGVRIQTGVGCAGLTQDAQGVILQMAEGMSLRAGRIILAAGGAAQPKLGGNESALNWPRDLGHQIVPVRPALVPLRTDSRSISGLSGLRVRGRVTLYTDGKPVHQEQGEILFGDQGISGICVMQCARFAEPGRSEMGIDLLYDLFYDAEELAEELDRRQAAYPESAPEELLTGLLARKMGYAVCKQAGLRMRGETVGELTSAQLRRMAETALDYRVRITGIEDFDRAQVTAGGVDCGEVRPENLESRLIPGLHITGELLNVDGDCGGFNLMFACMSGLRAGRDERKAGTR